MRTDHPEPALLQAFFDRTLSDSDARGVADHLSRCVTCASRSLPLLLGNGADDPDVPDIWDGIQRRLSAPRPVTRPGRFTMPGAWMLAAMTIVLVVISALRFARPGRPHAAALDVGAYLAELERSSDSSDLERLRARFEGIAPYDRVRALAEGSVRPDVDAYHLVEQLSWSPGRRASDIIQLLYASGTDAFALFVAPPGSVGAFGDYDVVDARIAGRRCRRVTCPREDVYVWTSRHHDYVFVRRHTAANASERLFADLVDGVR